MKLHGCRLSLLEDDLLHAYLDWVIEAALAPPQSPGLVSLLAYCDDGVVWGRLSGSAWQLGCDSFPEVSPRPTKSSLQQLHLFGELAEVLIWRAGDGLAGRVLAHDADQRWEQDDPLRPKHESLVLVGEELLAGPRDGFSLVGGARGTRQAVPVACEASDFRQVRGEAGHSTKWSPLRLELCHYFADDIESGAVRAQASRLLWLALEPAPRQTS